MRCVKWMETQDPLPFKGVEPTVDGPSGVSLVGTDEKATRLLLQEADYRQFIRSQSLEVLTNQL
jgi:hypothetical protein